MDGRTAMGSRGGEAQLGRQGQRPQGGGQGKQDVGQAMLTLTVAASEGGGNPSNTMQQHKSSLHLPSGGTRDFLRYCGDAARQDSGLQNCCGRRDQGGQEDGPFGIEGSHRVVTNTGGGGGGARRNHRGRRRTVDRLTEARGQRGWKATGATSKAGLTSTARRRQGGGPRTQSCLGASLFCSGHRFAALRRSPLGW